MDEIKSMLKALLEGQQVTNAKLETLTHDVQQLQGDVRQLKDDMAEVKERLNRVEQRLDRIEDGMKYLAGDVYFLKMRSRG